MNSVLNINCYCINLIKRGDKWEYIQEEVKKIGMPMKRFGAIKMGVGHDGCRASHLSLLTKARDEGIFMVIEDDMKIRVENPVETIKKAFAQLPPDWDMFYLGATLDGAPERFSENLYRLTRAWATHAIVYNNQNGVVDYILNNHNEKKYSVFLANIVQKEFKCYMTYPMVATQQAGFSDILKHNVSYSAIESRYQRFLVNRVEQI